MTNNNYNIKKPTEKLIKFAIKLIISPFFNPNLRKCEQNIPSKRNAKISESMSAG